MKIFLFWLKFLPQNFTVHLCNLLLAQCCIAVLITHTYAPDHDDKVLEGPDVYTIRQLSSVRLSSPAFHLEDALKRD